MNENIEWVLEHPSAVALAILGIIICWAIWATLTHNLPCSMVKGLFTINGNEFQNYAQRCGF